MKFVNVVACGVSLLGWVGQVLLTLNGRTNSLLVVVTVLYAGLLHLSLLWRFLARRNKSCVPDLADLYFGLLSLTGYISAVSYGPLESIPSAAKLLLVGGASAITTTFLALSFTRIRESKL